MLWGTPSLSTVAVIGRRRKRLRRLPRFEFLPEAEQPVSYVHDPDSDSQLRQLRHNCSDTTDPKQERHEMDEVSSEFQEPATQADWFHPGSALLPPGAVLPFPS
jgi:hypothetical protein